MNEELIRDTAIQIFGERLGVGDNMVYPVGVPTNYADVDLSPKVKSFANKLLESADKRIAELEAQLAECQATNRTDVEMFYYDLQAKLRECQKDAERYRWIRTSPANATKTIALYSLDALDKAIDAAIKESK